MCKYCLQGNFHPVLFLPFITCKWFRPIFNLARKSCVEREIIWDVGLRPVLNSSFGSEGERGENKTWANIFLCTVIKKNITHLFDSWPIKWPRNYTYKVKKVLIIPNSLVSFHQNQMFALFQLEEQTNAECAFLLLVVPETQELFCQVGD